MFGLRLLFLGVLVLLASVCAGQTKKSDSYRSYKLRSSQTEASELLNDAERLKEKNPDGALTKVKEALAISLAQQDSFGEGRSYLLLGEINEGILEWSLALNNFNQAHEKLSAFATSNEYSRVLAALGRVQLQLGNYTAAEKHLNDRLNLRLSQVDQRETRLLLSEVYYKMEKYDDALAVLDGITESKKISGGDTRVQSQQAKIFARKNEFEKTQNLYSNSLSNLRSEGAAKPAEQEAVQQNKEEIADVLQQQKRFDDEIELRQQSIEYNLESKNLTEVAKDKIAISRTLEEKGDAGAAIREAEEAAQIADTLKNPREQAATYLALAKVYDKNGRIRQALNAYKKYSDAVAKAESEASRLQTERAALLQKQRDIEELTKDVTIGQREDTIEAATVFRQQLIIYGLITLIVIIGVTSFLIFKNAQASKKANQLLALKSLRSQMNPHFIFNALNSVNHFIAQQDERTANRFLSEFAMLMRLVLDNSQEDFITLAKEQEILQLYLRLEHYRFRDKFEYELKIDEAVAAEEIEIPPMLIQPYIENAVWHGLRYRESKGLLTVNFARQNGELLVVISDNGIGRKKSAALKTENQKKHKSTGLKNIEQRLSIINRVYRSHYRVQIDDLANDSGTRVSIAIPLHKKLLSA